MTNPRILQEEHDKVAAGGIIRFFEVRRSQASVSELRVSLKTNPYALLALEGLRDD